MDVSGFTRPEPEEARGDFPVIPEGKHLLRITGTRDVTGKPWGSAVVFDLQVEGGPHHGAKGDWMLAVFHNSPDMANRKRKDLAAIERATGGEVRDTSELGRRAFTATVKHKPKGDGSGDVYVNYYDIGPATATRPSPPVQATAQAAAPDPQGQLPNLSHKQGTGNGVDPNDIPF